MTDEKYAYRSDVRDRSVTARSGRSTRTHNGKPGCKLPCDFLTKKEKEAMNGEVVSYRLNQPVKYAEFKVWPNDIKEQYLKVLVDRYKVRLSHISQMMGVTYEAVRHHLRVNGINVSFPSKETKIDVDGWNKFLGVEEAPAPARPEKPTPMVVTDDAVGMLRQEVERLKGIISDKEREIAQYKHDADELRNLAAVSLGARNTDDYDLVCRERDIYRAQVEIVRTIFEGLAR